MLREGIVTEIVQLIRLLESIPDDDVIDKVIIHCRLEEVLKLLKTYDSTGVLDK
jgi:hypothetical protein